MMNQKRYFFLIVFSIVLVLSIASCKEPKEASEIPFIEYIDATFVQDDSLVLKFHFIDGNGDLGLFPNDTVAPYNSKYREGDPLYVHKDKDLNSQEIITDSFNRNGYNLILKYEEFEDGEWVTPTLSPFLLFRIKDISPEGQDPYLEGDINVGLVYPSLINSDHNDSVKYSIELQDRALNLSNVIETGLIVKP